MDIGGKKGNINKELKKIKACISYVSPINKISSASRSKSPANDSLRSVKKPSSKQGSSIPSSSEPSIGALSCPLSVNEVAQQSSDSQIRAKMSYINTPAFRSFVEEYWKERTWDDITHG